MVCLLYLDACHIASGADTYAQFYLLHSQMQRLRLVNQLAALIVHMFKLKAPIACSLFSWTSLVFPPVPHFSCFCSFISPYLGGFWVIFVISMWLAMVQTTETSCVILGFILSRIPLPSSHRKITLKLGVDTTNPISFASHLSFAVRRHSTDFVYCTLVVQSPNARGI